MVYDLLHFSTTLSTLVVSILTGKSMASVCHLVNIKYLVWWLINYPLEAGPWRSCNEKSAIT